jgi:uncharacterized protein (TIGR02186 family)
MQRLLFLITMVLILASSMARAEGLIVSISSSRVLINSSYVGADLTLFGSIERDGSSISRSGSYDVYVRVVGPAGNVMVREKERVWFIWTNQNRRRFGEMPGYLAVHSSRPLAEITSAPLRERFQLSLMDYVAARQPVGQSEGGPEGKDAVETTRFNEALIRLRQRDNLFQFVERGVVFLSPSLFRANINLPSTSPIGNYEAFVSVYADGAPVATQRTDFEVVKVGFESNVALAASQQSFYYGLATLLIAFLLGWLANFAFRRD